MQKKSGMIKYKTEMIPKQVHFSIIMEKSSSLLIKAVYLTK